MWKIYLKRELRKSFFFLNWLNIIIFPLAKLLIDYLSRSFLLQRNQNSILQLLQMGFGENTLKIQCVALTGLQSVILYILSQVHANQFPI